MKKLIVVLSIICALSFIAFGLSYAILGRHYYGEATSHVSLDSGERSIFSEIVHSNSDWEIVNEFRTVNINSAGAKTIIQQNSGDRILVSAQVPDGRELYAGAKYNQSESKLTIEVRPKNITFSDIAEEFGKVLWTDDVFKFPEGVTVTISFPQTIYDELNIKLGSGKMYVDELYAGFTAVDIGSGTFEMQRSEDYEGGAFILDLGSGKAKVKNMRASSFDIDVGSGKFDITGLSRTGSIDIGSGSGTLVLGKECEDLAVDMGSGALDIYLEETGAKVDTDIGSGSVNISAYGMETKLGMNDDDNEPVQVGSGTAEIEIDMGSGSLDILEAAKAPALVMEIPKSESTGAGSSQTIASSSFGAVSQVTVAEDTSAIPGIVVETPPEANVAPEAPEPPELPEVPSAPEAPNAPEAPEAPASPVEAA